MIQNVDDVERQVSIRTDRRICVVDIGIFGQNFPLVVACLLADIIYICGVCGMCKVKKNPGEEARLYIEPYCALTISGRRGGTNETGNSHQQKSLLDAFKELIGCSEQ